MRKSALRSLVSLCSRLAISFAAGFVLAPNSVFAGDPSLAEGGECLVPASGGNGCVQAPTFEEQTADATVEQLQFLKEKLELVDELRNGGGPAGGVFIANFPTQPQHRNYYCGPATTAMILSHWGWNPDSGPLHMTQEMLARDEMPTANPPLNTTPEGGTSRWSFPPTLNAYVGDTSHGGNYYVWHDLNLDPTDDYRAGKDELWLYTWADIVGTFPTAYGVMTGPLEGYPQGNLDHYFPGRQVDMNARLIEIADPWLAYVYGENGRWYRSDNVWEAVHASPARDQILW